MRRARFVLLVACLLGTVVPARAAETFGGSILLPGGVEPLARVMYLADPDLNGLVGYVVDLGARWNNGTPWALTETAGLQPLSMYPTFYASISGSGQPCNYLEDSDDGTTRRGRIECIDLDGNGQVTGPERARWAIVVMLPGVAGGFSLTLG